MSVTDKDVDDLYCEVKARYTFTFDLKDKQKEQNENVMNRPTSDCFALLPTGHGKSVCLPSLLMHQKLGVQCTALIITPSKTLMDNQVVELRAKGITAAGIKQGISDAEKEDVFAGRVTHLFAIPKALREGNWRKVLLNLYNQKLLLQACDEAHTVSERGLDFRPTYRQVTLVTSILDAPISAVTATAT
ncbi:ATP-dependent DNA helicase Q-like 3 [Acanthaster planci]|uniref:ATP-dependent DNA helicase Q-like 3 n=1 Tax=Acanthaster planci TaxID=133434 RepID=A0A8B7Z763_ACAPL|nr:ATP-dependent DNA helicase Q-like 3 [Acanthaster planci]